MTNNRNRMARCYASPEIYKLYNDTCCQHNDNSIVVASCNYPLHATKERRLLHE